MSLNCEVCERLFVPRIDMERVFTVCSQSCRAKAYRKQAKIEDIENGHWHGMNVSVIEELGFVVTVTKKTDEGIKKW